MNIAVFDAQWIDVMTGWIIMYRAGYSVHSAFYGASRNLPDPYQSEWHKLNHDVESGAYKSLSEGLRDLASRIPSEALKLVADTFYQNWIGESTSYGLEGDVRNILKILWQNYGPQPAPSVTDFDEINSLLNQFEINDAHIRKQLLELGEHLIQWVNCRVDIENGHPPEAALDLLKSLNTPEAIRHLRRYVLSNKPRYRMAARQALRELGTHANAPQYLDFEGSEKSIDLYLMVNLEPDEVLKRMLDSDKQFQYDGSEPTITAQAGKVDDTAVNILMAAYEFAPTIQLHFDIPRLTDEQMQDFTQSRRSPEGKEIIKKILRMTFDRLRNTDWELLLLSDLMGLILMRQSGELLLNQNGFWVPANQEEVTIPFKEALLPFPHILYPER